MFNILSSGKLGHGWDRAGIGPGMAGVRHGHTIMEERGPSRARWGEQRLAPENGPASARENREIVVIWRIRTRRGPALYYCVTAIT
ncbi:hypothetical protein J19TS2_10410 [Cohnella xylanilytica]|nr:hypothetical protein J19TS2_10410 [Cohnella xylanilytica]